MDNYNFPVEERKIKTIDGLDVPRKAIVRTDTNKVLSVMGEEYALVKHSDVLDNIEKTIPTELINRKITLCKDGAILFARYETPKIETVEVKKGDIVKFGVEVFNSYDGSLPVGFVFIALRLVCTNGMTIPKSIARLSVRHTGGVKLNNVQEEFTRRLPLYFNTANRWREWADVTPSQEKTDAFLKSVMGERLRKQFGEEYQSAKDKTVWGLYNLLTYYNTHNINVRKNNTENKRLAQFNFEQRVLGNFYNYKWEN